MNDSFTFLIIATAMLIVTVALWPLKNGKAGAHGSTTHEDGAS